MDPSPDFDFLYSLADRSEDHEILATIEADRNAVYSGAARTARDEMLPELSLAGIRLRLPRAAAPSCADLLTEHFRDHAHAAVPRFDGSGDGILLDIGANIGLYTLLAKQRYSNVPVLAVEPVSKTFACLVHAVTANAARDVVAVRAALGDPLPPCFRYADGRRVATVDRRVATVDQRVATVSMQVARSVPSVASRSLSEAGPRWLRHVSVTTEQAGELALSELAGQLGSLPIQVMKIDVEGDEAAVLRGAGPVLSRVERVVVEYHGRANRRYCIAFLETRGFRLVTAGNGPIADLYFERNASRR